jgi:hypothetical protein
VLRRCSAQGLDAAERRDRFEATWRAWSADRRVLHQRLRAAATVPAKRA